MSKHSLFLLVAAALIVSGFFARAINARDAQVKAAEIVTLDQDGKSTAEAEADLTRYAATHTGASVTLTLSGSFARASAAAKAAATAPAAQPSSQIYAEAQAACAGRGNSIAQAKCNQDYLASRAGSTTPAATPAPVVAPKAADYERVFKSPQWTTDLAGSLLLGAALALVTGVITWMRGL